MTSPTNVDSVAAIAGLSPSSLPETLFLKAYNAGGTTGGGLLVYENIAYPTAAPQTPGLYFPVPGGIGRYRRVYEGKLTTNDFGIDHSGATIQGPQFQAFVNTCIAERCVAEISSSLGVAGIDCRTPNPNYDGNPANGPQYYNTIFLNSNGRADGERVIGFRLVGEDRRYSQLSNCILSVGKVFAIGTASDASGKGQLSGWYHRGSVHLWSLESAWEVSDLRIIPVAGMTPNYPANSIDFNYGLIAYACNHVQLLRVRVEYDALQDPDGVMRGAALLANSNLKWDGGGVNRCKSGIATGNIGLPAGTNADLTLEQLHFEGVREECIALDYVDSAKVLGCHVRGRDDFTSDEITAGVKPNLRIGDAAESSRVPKAVLVSGNWFSSTPKLMPGGTVDLVVATGVEVQRSTKVTIDGNMYRGYLTAVTAGALASGITVAADNVYSLLSGDDGFGHMVTGTDYVRNSAAARPLPALAQVAPVTLTYGTSPNIVWDMRRNVQANLGLDKRGTNILNPTAASYKEGENFSLVLYKQYDSDPAKDQSTGYVGSWGSMFRFNGTAPTLTGMTVGQACRIDLQCRMIPTATPANPTSPPAPFFLCDYAVVG